MQLTDLNIGVLFILALSSMGVYGIALAGWASNNKYSLLGGLARLGADDQLRAADGARIAAPLLISNTLSLREMVDTQDGFVFGFMPHWNILQGPFPQIFSFIIFMICGVRRNQSRAVRSARSGKRTGRRLPHRIQRHEVRGVLHGRIRQHDHGHLDGDAAVPGRLASDLARPSTAPG